jgi:RNA polymerase II elongation factor ELL
MRAALTKNGPSKAQARASLLNPLAGRSNPGSPAFGASTPLAAPTSAGLDSNMPMAIAGRKVLVHLLAVKPQTYETCRKLLHFNCRDLLDKVGKKNTANEWALLDRAYKELDVWKFKYRKDEERQTAIDGAIRAYDRMRISKEDELWQKLLPQDERGKGKVLSRLNIKNPKEIAATTPATKATSFNKKTGLPKRTVEKKSAEKKTVDKDTTKAKTGKDSEAETTKLVTAAKPRVSKDAAAKERLATKRKERASRDDDHPPARKQVKPSTAAKGLLNKPKNPSPLSASPPVNASDFENNHPVHKALSAAVSPKKTAKRKADDMSRDSSQRPAQQTNAVSNNKRRQLDSSSSSNNSPASQSLSQHTTKSHINDLTNGHSRPQQKHQHSGHHSPETSDSSNDRSPPITLSWKQTVDMAKRFKAYYDKYKRLHEELASSDSPPSLEKRKELLNMRERLERMKSQVREGVL